jgi:hypothetical protein
MFEKFVSLVAWLIITVNLILYIAIVSMVQAKMSFNPNFTAIYFL